MVPLINIERGTVVAGRYVVSEVLRPWLAGFPEAGTVCLVIDAILDEPAQLYVADSTRSGDLLDAARRAALLTDPRIPGLHDVGRADGLDFVVSERPTATPLPALLASGPLDPEAARALIGEAATALVHASKRGLHHLCLGPDSIGLTPEGEVEVRGMAIDAAVADEPYELGLDTMSSREALREDALALVTLLYAALTAHWPGEESRSGLPPAPKKNALMVRAETITPGIPRDLEEFVSGVITRTEAGPRSPSEIVRYLGEWDTRALVRLARGGASAPADEDLFPGGAEGFSGADARTSRPEATPGPAAPSTAAPRTPSAAPSTTAGAAGAGVGGAAVAGAGAARTAEAGSIPSGPAAHPPAAAAARDGGAGVRPSRTPAPGPQEDAEEAAPTRRATPQQLQAALKRIGMSRPGTSGLAAGVAGSEASPFDEHMQMRRATTFPVSVDSVDRAIGETREWQPEDTFSTYSEYASREHDENLTAPILNRDDLWTDSEDTQVIELDRHDDGRHDTEPGEEDDGSWFLGGMFTTREEELARQRADFERERRLQAETVEKLRGTSAAAAAVPGDLGHDLSDSGSLKESEQGSDPFDPGPTQPFKFSETARQKGTDPEDAQLSGRGASAGATASGTRPGSGASSKDGGSPSTAHAGARQGSGTKRSAGTAAAGAVGAAAAGASRPPADGTPDRTDRAQSTSPGTGASGTGTSGSGGSRRILPLVVGVLAVLVAIGLIIGLFVRPGSSPTAEETPQPTSEPTEASPAPTEDEAPAPVIASVEALDPEGDGSENDGDAEKVLPDVSGTWETDRYNSAEFGNLKTGLGLGFELEEEAAVSAVTLISGTPGGTVEIRVGDSDDPEEAETVATDELPDGTGTIELVEPATGTHVFVWITELPSDSGGFRARISEVEVS